MDGNAKLNRQPDGKHQVVGGIDGQPRRGDTVGVRHPADSQASANKRNPAAPLRERRRRARAEAEAVEKFNAELQTAVAAVDWSSIELPRQW